jgi:hypothetical protein
MLLCQVALFMSLFSCEFFNSRKKSLPDVPKLLSPNQIYFVRSHDLTSGFLTIVLNRAGYCEISYWLSEQEEPNIERTMHVCAKGEQKLSFDERLEPLDINKTYIFQITAWEPGQEKSQGEVHTGTETDLASYLAKQANFGELMVARMDVAMKSVSIHRYEFPNELETYNVISDLHRETGCQRSPHPTPSPYYKPSPVVKLKYLLSRGYGNSTAFHNPFDSHSLTLDYEVLQPGDGWEFSYSLYSQHYEFIGIAASSFQSLNLTSFNQVSMESPVLKTLNKSAQVGSNRQIILNWATRNLMRDAYVIALLQTNAPESNVVCYFDPSAGSGNIPLAALSHLDPGTYRVTVYLESKQIQRVPEAVNHYWLLSAVDWRSINLEFL